MNLGRDFERRDWTDIGKLIFNFDVSCDYHFVDSSIDKSVVKLVWVPIGEAVVNVFHSAKVINELTPF